MSFNDDVIRQFRENGGEVPRFGRGLVLVHHRGARSGQEYVNPVAALPTSSGWVIAASAAGADRDPAWAHNLRAHPDVEVETPDDGTLAVRVHELQGAERDAAWARFAENPGFAAYQERTDRVIPIFGLERR